MVLRKKTSSVKRKRISRKPGRKALTKQRRGRRKKADLFFALAKSEENPIIASKPENNWEAWQTFNPGVILLDDKIHFLYRAIGQDGVSRFGYAMSEDGFKIDERLAYPVYPVRKLNSLGRPESDISSFSNGVYEHQFKHRTFNVFSYFSGGSWGGCEDPRIVRVGEEDVLYMTYTEVGDGELRVALTSIKVNDFLKKTWHWKSPALISPPGQVHKNWVIFPEKIGGRYALLHSLNPEVQIAYLDNLDFDNSAYIQSFYGGKINEGCWDGLIKGAGPPPIKTEYGWLLFYHAIDTNDWSKYKAGAMLLDLEDPTKILLRSKTPILEPTELYENNGYKSGVVYVSGAVVKNGNLLVYYGGADSCVCVASANLKEFLQALIGQVKPKLTKQKVKK